MRGIKSYTKVWKVQKILYSVNDVKLPVPITFQQIAWFIGCLFGLMVFGNAPPFSYIDNALVKYIVLPVLTSWLMSQKTFDGMQPHRYIQSVILYVLRPKITFAGRPIKLGKIKIQEKITTVRSEIYGISN